MQKEVAPLPGPAPNEVGGVGVGGASRATQGHVPFLFKEESISVPAGGRRVESLCQGACEISDFSPPETKSLP